MNCSTCWFASGGDADHCGYCDCCPAEARAAAAARPPLLFFQPAMDHVEAFATLSKHDGPLGAANGVLPASEAERPPVYELGTQDGSAGESEETA